MKKILINLFIYTFLAGLICFLVGAFVFKVPLVNSSDVMTYRINNGLCFLLVAIPSIVISGFLIGCAVSFGDVKAPAYSRFSSPIADCFKGVVLISICATFLLAMAHDILLPAREQRRVELEEKPYLINQYNRLAQEYLLKATKKREYANLASFYAKKALELDRKNQMALDISKRAELAGATKSADDKSDNAGSKSLSQELQLESEPIDMSEINKINSSSVYELVQESQRLFEKDDYLGSHYYAQMAIRIAKGTDANLDTAKQYANRAWNILSDAKAERVTEANLFFRKKVEGYTKLMAGDFLSSYYIFQGLSNQKFEYSKDPDVVRYLNRARYELLNDYFFDDETEDKDTFESCENVYFSLKHTDGSYDIFFIKGITDVGNTGELVRYLREMTIYSFNSKGDFVHSMSVPYAKMLAVEVSTLNDEKREAMGVNPEWKLIPYIMLCSLDRNVEGKRIEPEYYSKDKEKITGPNQIFLSMPYEDFSVLTKCTNGIHKMNFWHFNKMKLAASSYGYSDEIILQSVLTSVFYPFMIFILLIFTASIGWNYRLQSVKVFKFIWLFVIPLVNVIMYGVVGFFEFFVKLMNFIFIGVAGTSYAIYLGVVFYLFLLIASCVTFLSRKGD